MPPLYRVIISPRAAADLADVDAYISKDSPQIAATVISRLVDAVDTLGRLPHRHQTYGVRGRPADEIVRRMPVPPYLIYYRVDDTKRVVEVITIRHGKRRLPGRLP